MKPDQCTLINARAIFAEQSHRDGLQAPVMISAKLQNKATAERRGARSALSGPDRFRHVSGCAHFTTDALGGALFVST
jgi:hypothetical protein